MDRVLVGYVRSGQLLGFAVFGTVSIPSLLAAGGRIALSPRLLYRLLLASALLPATALLAVAELVASW